MYCIRDSTKNRPQATHRPSLVVALLDEVCEMALTTVIAIGVNRHEDTGAAELMRALSTQTRDLVIGIDLIEFQHCQFHLLALVLDLLGLRVRLLLALLTA